MVYLETSSCWPCKFLANYKVVEEVDFFSIHSAVQYLPVVKVLSRAKAQGEDIRLCHLVNQLL